MSIALPITHTAIVIFDGAAWACHGVSLAINTSPFLTVLYFTRPRPRNATATTRSPSNPSFIKCRLVVTTPAIASVFFIDCVTSRNHLILQFQVHNQHHLNNSQPSRMWGLCCCCSNYICRKITRTISSNNFTCCICCCCINSHIISIYNNVTTDQH